MSDCTWLSDRMPDVAHGRAEWSLDETRHLAQCRSCLEEWELVQATNRLGESLRLSVDPIATSVVRLLGQNERRVQPRFRWWAAMAAAAALFAVLWMKPLSEPSTVSRDNTTSVARLELSLPELESLQPAELDSVLQTMDEPDGTSAVGDPGLADLNSDELQRVLNSWEG
jgi:hypothetical protein